jgi:hypothetical protein
MSNHSFIAEKNDIDSEKNDIDSKNVIDSEKNDIDPEKNKIIFEEISIENGLKNENDQNKSEAVKKKYNKPKECLDPCFLVCIVSAFVIMLIFLSLAIVSHSDCSQYKDWNNRAVKTLCIVTGISIQHATSCYYKSCSPDPNVPKTLKPGTSDCTGQCYNGIVEMLAIIINAENISVSIQVVQGDHGEDYTTQVMNYLYPIGQKIDCYYDNSNPSDVELQYKTYDACFGFAIAFDVMTCVAGLIFISTAILFLLDRYCD